MAFVIKRGARSSEVAVFTRQLAAMLEVGLPPIQTLQLLTEQGFSAPLTEAARLILVAIDNGDSLSHGMSRSPKVFNPLYISLVQAGEVNGKLPETLRTISRNLERAAKLRRDTLTAMIYPSCIIVTAAIVSSFLLVFAIPCFKDIFDDLGTELPWLTRIVISASEACCGWLAEILLAGCSLFFIASRLITTTRGRDLGHALSLKCPVIGNVIKKAALARVTRTLGTTLGAGIPILLALRVSAQAAGNSVVQHEIEQVRLSVSEGGSIFHSVQSSQLFPSTMIQMLRVGETTGSLDTILENIATHYEEEIERALTTLKQLLEPALVITLGVVVGTLVLAMYLPIFTMGSLIE